MDVYQGVWAPSARVLCWRCHGCVVQSHRQIIIPTDEFALMCDEVIESPSGPVAQCDSCDRPIRTSHTDVNALARLRRMVNVALGFRRKGRGPAVMNQTGGMCCALAIDLPVHRYEICVYVSENCRAEQYGQVFSACVIYNDPENNWDSGEVPDSNSGEMCDVVMVEWIKNTMQSWSTPQCSQP